MDPGNSYLGLDSSWTKFQVWSTMAYTTCLITLMIAAILAIELKYLVPPTLSAERSQQRISGLEKGRNLFGILFICCILRIIYMQHPAVPALWYERKLPILKTDKSSRFTRPSLVFAIRYYTAVLVAYAWVILYQARRRPLVGCTFQNWFWSQRVCQGIYLALATFLMFCLVEIPRRYDHFWSGSQRIFPPQNPEDEILGTPLIAVWGYIAIGAIIAFPLAASFWIGLGAEDLSQDGTEGLEDDVQPLLVSRTQGYGTVHEADPAERVARESPDKN